MSVVWSIEYAGIRRPLSDWGITMAKLSLHSLDTDELTLGLKTPRLDFAPTFPFGATVDLYRDAVRWFSGVVTQLPAEGSSEGEIHSYTISGPWWQFENLIYQDDRNVPIDPTDSSSALISVFTSHTVLFQNLNLSKRTLAAQITRTLTYAQSKGVAITIGTIDPAFDVPWEEARDTSCAEVLRRCTRWAPDTASWIDYTTTPPTIHFRRRGNHTAVSLAIDSANLIKSWSLTRREDLAPKGVLLYIQRTKQKSDGPLTTYFDKQSAGLNTGGVGCVVMTIPLAGDGTTEEPVPTNLATDFFSAASTVHYEGQIALQEPECAGLLRIGKVLNLTNGRPEYTSMNAQIQGVEEDIMKGTTTARVGLPGYLGARDLLELARVNRTREGDGSAALGRSSGYRDIANYASIVVCDGISEKTINVRTS